jgi:Family of unknown function (DUF6263)
MTPRILASALAVALLFAVPARSQTVLAWKFAKGQVLEAERVATQKQMVEIAAKQFKHERKNTWQIRLDVKEIQADGAIIQATLTKIEQQVIGGTDKEMIDPKLPEKMQGTTFTLRVSPAGRVIKFDGYEPFLQKVADKDDARLKALRISFPESAVKEALGDLFGPLPDKAVARGDGWQREYVEPIPHFGSLRSTAQYIYDGEADGRARIAYTIRTRYETPTESAGALFRIVDGNIASDKAKGAIVFDTAAGRLVEHERTMLLRGKLTVEAMDRRQPLEFTSENVVKIRVRLGKN